MSSLGLVAGGSVSLVSKRDRFVVCTGLHREFQRKNNCNWDGVIPQVSKSAGFWSVGLWLQVDAGKKYLISLMRWMTKCFGGLLP